MTLQVERLDTLLKNTDPLISETLNRALSDKEISEKEAVRLYGAKGIDFHLVGMVANELRKRRVGDVVTYVVNRNINFTNVCIKRCGFCAFSRDFREEEGYLLPVEEIVNRAKEAHRYGATEVCIQAGLPPDMESNLYEKICRAIKSEVPEIHIHGFSPEEVLYGATRSEVSKSSQLLPSTAGSAGCPFRSDPRQLPHAIKRIKSAPGSRRRSQERKSVKRSLFYPE